MLIKNYVAQSNDGTYLAIPHLDSGGNDVVHKFSGIRRSTLLGPSTLTRFRDCSYSSLFLLYTASHNQNIVQQNTEFCISSFHRTLVGFKLPLSNHLKFTFQKTLYWYAYSISCTLMQYKVHFFFFQANIYKNVIDYFIRRWWMPMQ